jgi:DNA polymerase-1
LIRGAVAEKLLLVDASSSIYRAFFALPALANARGVPTHATLGFTTMLLKVLREERPDRVVVVWDSPGRKRRHEVYAAYKATRDAMPDDLRSQLPYIRRIVAALGIPALEHPGEEADDVIATLARRAREAGLDVAIVSSDRDLYQIVSERVTIVDTARDRRLGPKEVEERFGVPPARILDLRALVGDSSDNIPGVRGIGEKGAAELLRAWGTLDDLLAHAIDVKGRYREPLVAGAESARLSRELSRLHDDLPLAFDLEQARPAPPDTDELRALFSELEFRRLADELPAGAPAAPAPAVAAAPLVAERVSDPSAIAALVERLGPRERLGLALALEPADGLRGRIVALALADAPDHALVIEPAQPGTEPALDALGALFRVPERAWLGHELKRAWLALERRGLALGGALRDVSVAAYVDDSSQQLSRPDALARAYLGREIADRETAFGKGAKRRLLDAVAVQELAPVIAAEAASAVALDTVLGEKLAAAGQRALYEEIEVPLVRVLARMERAGVRVDEGKLAELRAVLEAELSQLERRIYDLAGGEFKINSPRQLQQVLFEKLALPPAKRTKTGFSTDESVLEELALQHELPAAILEHRRVAKLLSTYVEALPAFVNPETGRIHTSFDQTVAATGRLSSSNPNLQNIPIRTPAGERIREAFIPAEGRLLFSADYSQIELRILAHLSGDEALVEAFRSGDDVHVRTASQVFGVPVAQVTPEQRSRVKAINFGIIYGSSAFGIARQLGIAQQEARDHIRVYFERYPGVRRWLDEAVVRARRQGYAETLAGRRRHLPELRSSNRVLRAAAERMAVNSVIQGTAADLIKRAMVEIDRQLEGNEGLRARMILQVHDELVFEVPPAELPALQALVLDRMKGVCELSVPVDVHVGSGRSWREAH